MKCHLEVEEYSGCERHDRQPFTIIMDSAGNSFIEIPSAPNPNPDPSMTGQKYNRMTTQDMALGMQPSKVTLEAGTIDESIAAHRNIVNDSCFDDEKDRVQHNISQTLSGSEMDPMHEEVMKFPTFCPCCQASVETIMCITNIPHFKEVVIMSLQCEQCGYKSNDIKGGGAIPQFGTKIKLHVNDGQDLSREVLKSDTAGVSVPELDLELEEGSLAGVYTTVEGLLLKMHDRLRDIHPFGVGNSSIKQHADNDGGDTCCAQRREHVKYNEFLTRLKDMATGGRIPFTLILTDPLSNSFVGPKPENDADAPSTKNADNEEYSVSCHELSLGVDGDKGLEMEEYERTEGQNESLGLNDINTKEHYCQTAAMAASPT